MLQRPYTVAPAAAQDPTITGYNLAYSKRDPAERAILAARLHLGQLQLVSPRITQAAAPGVSRAGYTVTQETPILLIVFAIPAAVALFIWWRFSRG